MSIKVNVNVTILDGTHTLSCFAEERELLVSSAELFNNILKDLRRDNVKISTDKLMVLGGIRLAFELLQEREKFNYDAHQVNQIAHNLVNSLDQAIASENINEVWED